MTGLEGVSVGVGVVAISPSVLGGDLCLRSFRGCPCLISLGSGGMGRVNRKLLGCNIVTRGSRAELDSQASTYYLRRTGTPQRRRRRDVQDQISQSVE